MSEQNYKDQGSIIGYSPDIRLSRTEVKGNYKQVRPNIITKMLNINPECSLSIQDYLANTPDVTIEAIYKVVDIIDDILEDIVAENTKYNLQSIMNDYSSEESQNILQESDKIDDGDVAPDIVEQLRKEQEYLNNMATTFKKIYYGTPDISIPQMKDTQEEVNDKIVVADLAKTGLNYIGVVYDAALNSLTKNFCSQLSTCIKQYDLIIGSDYEEGGDDRIKNILVGMYADAQSEYDLNKTQYYNQHTVLNTNAKSLYNYYNKRTDATVYYESIFSKGSEFLYSNTSYITNKVEKTLEEFAKDINANLFYIRKNQEIFDKKQNLIAIFNSIS